MIIIINDNDYQLHKLTHIQLKIVLEVITSMYMFSCRGKIMATEKISTLLADVSIEGDLVEKDKLILDAKISGDIKANEVETHSNSFVKGNIDAEDTSLGGKLKGNVNSDKIKIRKTAEIEGVLNQKTLSIEEGANLKIKTETYK